MEATVISTPVGRLLLVAHEGALIEVRRDGVSEAVGEETKVLTEARKQLEEYFAGRRESFDLPLAPIGTPYQKKVWAALREIPFGEESTYGVIAEQVRSPKGYRAVGTAVGKNPLLIITPCHRVNNKNSKIKNFSAGVPVKEWLQTHEAVNKTKLGS